MSVTNNYPMTCCPICMSRPVFAIRLSCDHLFCYLCVKGVVTNGNNRCPLCRRDIDRDDIIRPNFVSDVRNSDRPSDFFRSHQWFYEGRRGTGYWAYDHFNGQLLEQAYTTADRKLCEIMISGVVYCVDFVRQIQYQKDNISRKRRIKRDLLSNIESTDGVKGIAGVSKYLIRELFTDDQNSSTTSQTTANADTSGQQRNQNNEDLDNEDTGERVCKRIKVEIKEEPADSTTDD
ncbi:E3 ubiquitin-protein ligase rnf146-like [Oppia nitens]|uniref:E3 ubiquitin-protein ligase rnf146-like n=1 Tax=Oppia nitens TaxID=1686743 RepID=UPI0023DAD6B0|nr:E3 ubiquitin-protein ligase rnf146-like [Oppia nitens]